MNDQPNPAPSGPVQQWRPLLQWERADVNDTECLTPDGEWVKAAGAHGYTLAECYQTFAGPVELRTFRPDPAPPQPAPEVIDPQNEPHTCPYCDQPREDTFEHQFRFKCGTSLRRIDHKTVKQSSECKLRVDYSRLVVENTRLKCGTPQELATAPDRHEASRAAFERSFAGRNHLRNMHGTYIDRETYFQWQAWCRALDHAAQEQPYYIDKRQTCPACGLPHTGDHRCMTQEQPAPAGSAVEWLDRDGREWPLPIHAQRIVFEGCDSVTMPPEAYLALYHDALALAQRCDAAEGQVKYYARSVITLSGQFDKAEAKLADAERRVERLREVLRLIQWSGGGHTDEGLYCNGSWCAEQARAALAETKEDAR